MGLAELLLLAVGLSMDAFAVSICKGLSMKKAGLKESAICGGWFGSFQAIMPVIGFFLASTFSEAIRDYDHWVAFGLLAIIGINMLKEAFEKECDCCEDKNADLSFKTMFVMAVATSIDAMASGIGIKMKSQSDWDILLAAVLIGGITFLMAALGVRIGNRFGNKYEKKAQLAGGCILILLGLKILIEDLFFS